MIWLSETADKLRTAGEAQDSHDTPIRGLALYRAELRRLVAATACGASVARACEPLSSTVK
jgi:hypothetical protein